MTIKGNALLGPSREESSKSHAATTRPSSRVSQLKKKARERIPTDEEESSDESSIYSGRSRDSSISRPTRHASSRPAAHSLDHAGLDEGYGTSSIQGDRSRKGKDKMDYGVPSASARRKAKTVSSESENDESSMDGDETHLAEQENDEEDSDDDDDVRELLSLVMGNADLFRSLQSGQLQ